ncbi:MAG: hypothetical protein KJ047_10130 [Anaerolineae bacterium]|nr:hypothetical protein [Anaerolineae bacterium]MEB2288753.1 hypothetical protein [Anaerolineae bacterium]
MSEKYPPTRERVFRFIVEYKRQHDGLSPAIKEISRACVLHTSTVKYHLLKLENQGRIRINGRRAIEVIGGVWNLPDQPEAPAP